MSKSSGFLCLSRGQDESVVIGETGMKIIFASGECVVFTEPIEVKLMLSKEGKTMIGTRAPKAVPVHRKEYYESRK